MYPLVKLRTIDGVGTATGDLVHHSGSHLPESGAVGTETTGAWSWDGATFELRTDRYGYLPFYYHHDPTNGALTISDAPQRVAASIPGMEFDPLGVGVLCRAGFMVGDRTLYRGVHRIPGASVLRWSREGLSIEQAPAPADLDCPGSPEDALDGWIDRFRVAIDRTRPGEDRFLMPLSGGRDSRMMLLELLSLGTPPREVITIGSPGNADVRLARTIARRSGLPMREVGPSRSTWLEAERIRHSGCGYEAVEHGWLLPLWAELLRDGHGWYDGLGCGSVLRNPLNTRRMHDLINKGAFDQWCRELFSLTSVVPSGWLERIRRDSPVPIAGESEVVDLVSTELASHLDRPNPITSFTFHNWGRRSIALNPFGLCRASRGIRVPYMDPALVDWSLAIPAEWSTTQDLQTRACHRLFPEYDDVPFELPRATNRNRRPGPMVRLRGSLQRRRFFDREGACFRSLHRQAADNRGDPGAFKAVNLMTHLVLADSTLKRVS